ncbi:MAG: hypothetical protein V4629_08330 [Pseudomonadota bacterium]
MRHNDVNKFNHLKKINRVSSVGSALITVIFIMVVMAGAVLMMSSLLNVQNAQNITVMQSARATFAANSGLEWAAFKIKSDSACPANSSPGVGGIAWTVTEQDLNGYSITVTCEKTIFNDDYDAILGQVNVSVYHVISTAEIGDWSVLGATPDYVFRRVEAFFEYAD